VVHAIFIVINIEFLRLIGDYLSAKFELFIVFDDYLKDKFLYHGFVTIIVYYK